MEPPNSAVDNDPAERYWLSEEDLQAIYEACRPVPLIFLSGGKPAFPSAQENANAAWERLGEKMGFNSRTVEPCGEGDRVFMAERTRHPPMHTQAPGRKSELPGDGEK